MNEKVLGNLERGLFFILSAPAGTGKTTLVNKLQKEFDCVVESVSFTTRKPRQDEIDGVHYTFISDDEFAKKIKNKDFLEYAKVFDNYYGTDKNRVMDLQTKGKHVFLVIDTQGAMQLRGKLPGIFIFLLPPSKEVLKSRLRARQTEDEKETVLRLSQAEKEMLSAEHYDYVVVNDELSVAYDVLRSIVIAEEHRQKAKIKER